MSPESEVVAALPGSQALFKDIVDSFLLGPLEVPAGGVNLSPLPVEQGLENAVLERRFEGDLRA